jgi:hypothetical protein
LNKRQIKGLSHSTAIEYPLTSIWAAMNKQFLELTNGFEMRDYEAIAAGKFNMAGGGRKIEGHGRRQSFLRAMVWPTDLPHS